MELVERASASGDLSAKGSVLCNVFLELGVVERKAGRCEQAIAAYVRAGELDQEIHGREVRRALLDSNRGNALVDAGRLREAAHAYAQSIAALRGLGKTPARETDPTLALSLNGLAGVYLQVGQNRPAITVYDDLIALRETMVERGVESPVALAKGHTARAIAWERLGALVQASYDFRRALALMEHVGAGANPPDALWQFLGRKVAELDAVLRPPGDLLTHARKWVQDAASLASDNQLAAALNLYDQAIDIYVAMAAEGAQLNVIAEAAGVHLQRGILQSSLEFECATAFDAAVNTYDFVLQHRPDYETLSAWAVAMSWLIKSVVAAGGEGVGGLLEVLGERLEGSERPDLIEILREAERLVLSEAARSQQA